MHAWSRRLIAAILAIVGAAAPLATSLLSPTATPRLSMFMASTGLSLLVAAVVLFEWSERKALFDRMSAWEPAVQQMRAAGLRLEQMQRRLVEIDENTNDIKIVKHLLNEERHNLSLVASGMVEIRGILDVERANLGALASGVHDIRDESDRRSKDGERLSSEVQEFSEIVRALRIHLDALSSKLAILEDRSITEQQNLGLVAAGLDVVRRSSAGVERFDLRQAAFEDALLSIADRVDELLATQATRDEAA